MTDELSPAGQDGPFDLAGAVAVVTGATRGLGRATATALADAGARVVVVGRSTHDAPHRMLPGTLEEAAADLRDRGAEVLAVQADLNQRDDAQRVVDEVLAWAGRCDVLVCNASYTPAGDFFAVPASRWTTGWNITVLSSVILLQGFLPGMLERGRGRVTAVGSRAARYAAEPAPGSTEGEDSQVPLLYGVSKAALERLIVGLHDSYGGRGVSFTNLRSGPFASESFEVMSGPTGFAGAKDRVNTPAEVAAALRWLITQPESLSGHIVDFPWLQARGVLPTR